MKQTVNGILAGEALLLVRPHRPDDGGRPLSGGLVRDLGDADAPMESPISGGGEPAVFQQIAGGGGGFDLQLDDARFREVERAGVGGDVKIQTGEIALGHEVPAQSDPAEFLPAVVELDVGPAESGGLDVGVQEHQHPAVEILAGAERQRNFVMFARNQSGDLLIQHGVSAVLVEVAAVGVAGHYLEHGGGTSVEFQLGELRPSDPVAEVPGGILGGEIRVADQIFAPVDPLFEFEVARLADAAVAVVVDDLYDYDVAAGDALPRDLEGLVPAVGVALVRIGAVQQLFAVDPHLRRFVGGPDDQHRGTGGVGRDVHAQPIPAPAVVTGMALLLPRTVGADRFPGGVVVIRAGESPFLAGLVRVGAELPFQRQRFGVPVDLPHRRPGPLVVLPHGEVAEVEAEVVGVGHPERVQRPQRGGELHIVAALTVLFKGGGGQRGEPGVFQSGLQVPHPGRGGSVAGGAAGGGFQNPAQLGEDLRGEKFMPDEVVGVPRAALLSGGLRLFPGPAGNFRGAVEIALDVRGGGTERGTELVFDLLEGDAAFGVLQPRDGVDRQRIGSVHAGQGVVIAAGEAAGLAEGVDVVEFPGEVDGIAVSVQREVGPDHQIASGLMPSLPETLVVVDLLLSQGEHHRRAEAELITVAQTDVLRRLGEVGVDESGEFRVLVRSHFVGDGLHRLVEFDHPLRGAAQLTGPAPVAGGEFRGGGGFAVGGRDFGIVLRQTLVADALVGGVVALEVDAGVLRIEVFDPVLDDLLAEGLIGGIHADQVLLTAPVGRVAAAGPVGEQVEELGMRGEVFIRPLLEAVGIVLFGEIPVAPVTQQPDRLLMHEVSAGGDRRPVVDLAPQLPEEEEPQPGMVHPFAALEVEGRGFGNDLPLLAGIEPAHAVGVFQNVVNGEERAGGLHQQRAEVLAAVVAGDDELVVVRRDPRVVVLHVRAGNAVPTGEIGLTQGDDETSGGSLGIAGNRDLVSGGLFHVIAQFLRSVTQAVIGLFRNEYHGFAGGGVDTDGIGRHNRQRRNTDGERKKHFFHLMFSCCCCNFLTTETDEIRAFPAAGNRSESTGQI